MATRELGSLRTYNPWPMIGWGTAAAIIIVAGLLGFGRLACDWRGSPLAVAVLLRSDYLP